APMRADPAWTASGEVVSGQCAADGHDDHVVDHQRRAGEAPRRSLGVGFGRGVSRPHYGAVASIECVQNSGGAKGVDSTVVESRRSAPTGSAIRLPEADRIAVSPYRLAR